MMRVLCSGNLESAGSGTDGIWGYGFLVGCSGVMASWVWGCWMAMMMGMMDDRTSVMDVMCSMMST